MMNNIPQNERERGQILAILALGMVALIAALGLALDTGVLFVRRAQLERSVDAAALAGVFELFATNPEDQVDEANERAVQLMAANGILIDNWVQCPEHPEFEGGDPDDWDNIWTNNDLCGDLNVTTPTVPGAIRFYVEAQMMYEPLFMSVLGFEEIPLRSVSEAEYYPVVDMYANPTAFSGVVRTSTQSIFGPKLCTSYGDAYTPANSPYWDEISGRYTYRVLITEEFYNTYNSSAATGGEPLVRIELLDPETSNTVSGGSTSFSRNGVTEGESCNRKNACAREINAEPEAGNKFWFFNLDENRGNPSQIGNCTNGGGYSETNGTNTTTVYRLYYYRENPDGTLSQVDLAYYEAGPNNSEGTDLHWVSPGVPAEDRRPAPGGEGSSWPILQDIPFDDSSPFGNWRVGGPGQQARLLCHDNLNRDEDPDTRHCFLADVDGDGDYDGEPATTTEDCTAFGAQTMDYAWPGHPQWGDDDTFNPNLDDFARYGYTNCPGNGDFTINLDTETPDMFVDSRNNRYLYLEVIGVDGFSENAFELWAGPVPAAYDMPSNVNARNMFVVNMMEIAAATGQPELDPRDVFSQVQVFGLGRIPMNSFETNRVDIPLTYISSQFQGQEIVINHFDADAGASGPMYFFFENVPIEDWAICFGTNAECQNEIDYPSSGDDGIPSGNQWNEDFVFAIPGEADGVAFYGGALTANYRAGSQDTYVWRISMESRPYLIR